jgi:hypothetical protein
MTTALVVTGHRTNPFDLDGSFTVHFNARDLAGKIVATPVTSREITLSVEARATVPPTIHFRLFREADGMRFEDRMECPHLKRNFRAVTAHFTAPAKPGPLGQFKASLFWDGVEGLLLARWIVPRPQEHFELSSPSGVAELSRER